MKKLLFILIACQLAAVLSFGQTDPETRLKELKITLPKPPSPVASYVEVVQSGNLLFLAGHGPDKGDGSYMTGKVGKDLTTEEGKHAAYLTGLSLLSTIKATIGSLNKVKRIVKVTGMVNCTPDFGEQPQVINGCSDLMVSIFGDKGKHARSAVGMSALPINIPVEIEMIVEIE